jgi:2'-5' RNA ligase
MINQTTLPGYQQNEYLLVLKPHEELLNKIVKVKEEFATKYSAPLAKVLKPHIALVTFTAWTMAEEKIVQRLQHIAMGISPIKIELNNYGSFPSHTIYINVTSKVPIQNLVKEIKEAQRILKTTNEHKPHFIEAPHIAIARKLKPWQFEQGWLEYSHRQFTGRFIADSMLLLKRSTNTQPYQIAKRFEFQNLPVATKQASLFM